MTKVEDFVAEWKLISSDNFENFMAALGVGFMMRKLGSTTKPNINFAVSGDQWTMTTTSALKTNIIKYKLNEEFDEATVDGRNCKSLIVFDGSKLVHTQKDKSGNVQCLITRELTEDGKMKSVATAKGVESVRIYEKETKA